MLNCRRQGKRSRLRSVPKAHLICEPGSRCALCRLRISNKPTFGVSFSRKTLLAAQNNNDDL